mmetsp:Transcript_3447/g.9669  ORF Transcript_3447/g.9669 Transcript_3447/m.9669 type:complete len:108 (+) Transcript_3447:253-576(+)
MTQWNTSGVSARLRASLTKDGPPNVLWHQCTDSLSLSLSLSIYLSIYLPIYSLLGCADPEDMSRVTTNTRKLGLVVCRGTVVMAVSPTAGIEEIANPFTAQMQQPAE